MSVTATVTKQGNKLGLYLATIRRDREFSLRQVETLTNKAVSNAYLSQIESGKIGQPSPNILHALSQVYKVSYEQLMQMAGFIVDKQEPDSHHGRAAFFADVNLTAAEEQELLDYLAFRRKQKKAQGT